jgi:cysteine synthase
MKTAQYSSKKLNVFEGKNALLQFLDPTKLPPTPLVELPAELNPFAKEGVRIYAKLMNLLPLGNVKAVSAFNMLDGAKKRGELSKTHTIVEYSSGNTIFSAAAAARSMGVNCIQTLISHEAFRSRIDMLRFLGIEVLIHQEPVFPKRFDKRSGIEKAIRLGSRKGYFCLRQYENPDNPNAHMRVTGPQIWNQMNEDVSIFCAGIGTTGTIAGTSKYLKKRNKNIFTLGVARRLDSPVPGVRSIPRLELIRYDWKPHVDAIEEVSMRDSYTQSLVLSRQGILVGPSSGFALQGLMQFLRKAKRTKKLEQYRNKKGEIRAVFVCCDGPFQYLPEYFQYVDKKYFPKVKS